MKVVITPSKAKGIVDGIQGSTLTEAGYEMAKPDGAFYLFIKAPGGDAYAFSEKAKQKDLLVVPGDGFGCPGYFRICYCVSPEKIRRSLPLFEELIKADA